MKLQLIRKPLLLVVFLISCSDHEFNDPIKNTKQDFDISSRSLLSRELLDSTISAEKLIKEANASHSQASDGITNGNNGGSQQGIGATVATSLNYALQATVSAQSTYPGYSVLKINDGSRNTTVGPSYSWANNYPDGTRLPQSVFLKFNSLRKISQIDIYTSSGYELQNYTIQFRTTSTASWITLLSVIGNTAVFRSHTFPDVNVLEIQIICQLGPPIQTIYGRLNEVEIYGTAEPTLPYIQNESGVLAFNSLPDVDQAIAYLEYKYDQYSDAFATQYPNLTPDQFADVEESVGFNDDQPYIDFENMYGISSLRALISTLEQNWLLTTAGDETAGPDPDDSYMDDYEMRTLVNSDGYIKVGTIYYVFLSDGSYYSYDGGGGGVCTTCPLQLAAIKNLKPEDPLPKGVKRFKSTQITPYLLGACRSDARSKGFYTNADKTWRIKWKLKVWDGPFAGPGSVKAVTKSYRKKNNSWQSRGAIIAAQAYGNVVSQDCTSGAYIESILKITSKRQRKVKIGVSVTNLAVKNGEIFGFHYHEIVGGYNSTLTW